MRLLRLFPALVCIALLLVAVAAHRPGPATVAALPARTPAQPIGVWPDAEHAPALVGWLELTRAAAAQDLWRATILWNSTVEQNAARQAAEDDAARTAAARRAVARSAPPAPKPSTSTASSSGVVTGSGQVNGWPCGGDLPPCTVLRRESGGNPQAVNPTGCVQTDPTTHVTYRGCFGLWQFGQLTWRGLGYAGVATDYSGDEQNAAARRLWNSGRGCSNWGACGFIIPPVFACRRLRLRRPRCAARRRSVSNGRRAAVD